jgi:hypothetical protein
MVTFVNSPLSGYLTGELKLQGFFPPFYCLEIDLQNKGVIETISELLFLS